MNPTAIAYMDAETFGRFVAEAVKAATEPLVARVKALEATPVTKSLDVEAYGALEEIAERLEKLEKDCADLVNQGFRYRGYWRDGFKAKKQDAVTHNGSLWLAIRDTSDTPDNTSADWNVIARKGRDGRDASA